jgi:hypothetical protein
MPEIGITMSNVPPCKWTRPRAPRQCPNPVDELLAAVGYAVASTAPGTTGPGLYTQCRTMACRSPPVTAYTAPS